MFIIYSVNISITEKNQDSHSTNFKTVIIVFKKKKNFILVFFSVYPIVFDLYKKTYKNKKTKHNLLYYLSWKLDVSAKNMKAFVIKSNKN